MIKRFKAENIGSVLKIWIAPVFAFQKFIPSGPIKIQSANLTFIPGQDWTQIYCTSGTMGLQVDDKETANGMYHPVSIVGFIPGEDLETTEALITFRGQRVIAKVLTANGQIRIAGTPEAPLSWTAPQATGTTPESRAGRNLEISGDVLTEPFYLI